MENMDTHKFNDSTNISYDHSTRNSRAKGSNIAGDNRQGTTDRKRSPSNSLEVRNNSYDNRKLTNDDVFLKSK